MSSAATRVEPTRAVSPSSSRFALAEQHRTVFCLILFAVTLVSYNPVVHDGFVLLDDVPYILGNAPVRAGLTWETVKWSLTSFHAGFWHPLTWLSHALDCQLFGLNPAGHHYVSLLFHATNAVLLFLLLQEATGLVWPCFVFAALFSLHPVNVESVAWAAERKNVLSMLFFLLAVSAYGRYARLGGMRRYATVALLFLLGMAAKPQIITLPCVLLLWDYWPLQRMFKEPSVGDSSTPVARSLAFLFLEKIPLFAMAAAGSIITVKGQRSVDAVRPLSEFPFSVRLENAVVSYGRYLKHLFWPTHLTPLYPHPGSSLPLWQVAVGSLVLIVLSGAALWCRRRRYLAVGWFWFLGILVPMIGLVQVGEQAMADRFEYIPMIGVLIALVWGGYELVRENKLSRNVAVATSCVAVAVLGGLTYHQLGYWKDGETLFRYTLSITEKNYMAYQALGMALENQGRVGEAIAEFQAAEALHDFPASQVLELGIYEQRNGHVQEAIGLYTKVLRKSTDLQMRAKAWDQMGSANIELKNFDVAKQAYQNALQIRTDDAAALLGSGLLAERSGETSQAVEQLSLSAKLEPSDVRLLLLARALRRDRRPQEAQAAEELATKISPDLSQAEAKASQIMVLFGFAPSANLE